MQYDDYDEEEYGEEDLSSLPKEHQQSFLYDLIGFKEDVPGDSFVRDTFWDVMYNDELSLQQRMDLYDELSDYLYDEYGLEFDDIWDWDAFREWYG